MCPQVAALRRGHKALVNGSRRLVKGQLQLTQRSTTCDQALGALASATAALQAQQEGLGAQAAALLAGQSGLAAQAAALQAGQEGLAAQAAALQAGQEGLGTQVTALQTSQEGLGAQVAVLASSAQRGSQPQVPLPAGGQLSGGSSDLPQQLATLKPQLPASFAAKNAQLSTEFEEQQQQLEAELSGILLSAAQRNGAPRMDVAAGRQAAQGAVGRSYQRNSSAMSGSAVPQTPRWGGGGGGWGEVAGQHRPEGLPRSSSAMSGYSDEPSLRSSRSSCSSARGDAPSSARVSAVPRVWRRALLPDTS